MIPATPPIGTMVGDSGLTGAADQAAKSGASGFDKVRAQLEQTADSLGVPLPRELASPSAVPSAQTLTAPSGADATAPARRRVEQSLSVSRHHIDRIQNQIQSQVTANPATSSLDRIGARLTSIENQYNQLDSSMRAMPQDATPQQWLRLQQMANSMNENINVLSKLVDSAASGVKTVLQTQI